MENGKENRIEIRAKGMSTIFVDVPPDYAGETLQISP